MNNYQYRIPNEHLKLHEIHPSVKFGERVVLGINVIIGPDVIIGDDCFIGHNTHIRHGSILGDRVTIRTNCLIDPDCRLGNDIKIMPHAIVGGGTTIEDKVYYGPFSLTTNTNTIGFHRNREADHAPPYIKMGAIIGAGCMIKPGVMIGKNSVLGLGSVLTKSIPDNEMWVGNPAKKLKEVDEDGMVVFSEEKVSEILTEYHEFMGKA
jgi:acetyltransferase-like isoleucine patch superfamily enzyme